MRIRTLHPWNVTPREAIAIQESLRGRVATECRVRAVRYVAGADITWEREEQRGFLGRTARTSRTDGGRNADNSGYAGTRGYAGIIVFRYPELDEVERVWAAAEAAFPYVPGLLSFRECPLLLTAFERLTISPDVILVDGHGLAHPRRIGIASHLGLLLDRPTIGCAKSRLVGAYREPALRRGSRTQLRDGGETVGMVVRTRDAVKPIFVSVGHLMDLKSAVALCLRCSDGFRIPKPTRLAHQFVGELRRHGVKSNNSIQK
jgi:deoxyribonuclease V